MSGTSCWLISSNQSGLSRVHVRPHAHTALRYGMATKALRSDLARANSTHTRTIECSWLLVRLLTFASFHQYAATNFTLAPRRISGARGATHNLWNSYCRCGRRTVRTLHVTTESSTGCMRALSTQGNTTHVKRFGRTVFPTGLCVLHCTRKAHTARPASLAWVFSLLPTPTGELLWALCFAFTFMRYSSSPLHNITRASAKVQPCAYFACRFKKREVDGLNVGTARDRNQGWL